MAYKSDLSYTLIMLYFPLIPQTLTLNNYSQLSQIKNLHQIIFYIVSCIPHFLVLKPNTILHLRVYCN